MKNVVIKVLDAEHGKKVIEYFKSLGVNTRNYLGSNSEKRGDSCIYYGVIKGVFDNYSLRKVELSGTNIIKLQNKIKENSMEIFKKQTIKINGLEREITVAVVITAENEVRAGYSIRLPEDSYDEALAQKIATGRALKDKTNLNKDMKIHESMKRKYILHCIADNVLNKIERGVIKIKGVK